MKKILILSVLVVLLFGRIIFNNFVYDDQGAILANKVIQNVVSPIPYFIDARTIRPLDIEDPDVYRPLSTWFFAIEEHLFSPDSLPDPFYFHLINLLLHAANTILFFLLLKKLFKDSSLPFWGALIFGIHPLMTESVAWAFQQSGLWSWFFSFLAILVALSENFEKKWEKIIFISVLSFGAVFSKEQAIILPFLYLLLLLCLKLKIKKYFKELIAFTAPVILYFLFRHFFLGSFSQMAVWGGSRFIIFLTMINGLAYYFKLMFWPHPLSLNYDSFPLAKSLMSPYVIFSGLVLLSIIFLAIIFWRKRPLFSLGIFWIFIVLAPVSNFIFPTKTIINERFLYFALPGLIISLLDIISLIKIKKFLLPLAIIICIIFSIITFVRLGDWKEELTLWRHELELHPHDWRNQTNYAYSLEMENKSEEAIGHYQEALQLAPGEENEFSTASKLINAYLRTGKENQAEEILATALKKFPGNDTFLFDLGKTYLQEKKYELAAETFKNLSEKNNNEGVAAFFSVLAEKLNGQDDEKIKTEIENFKDPDLKNHAFDLIESREKMLEEKWPEAVYLLESALQNYRPPMLEPYFWLAQSLEKINEKPAAVDVYQSILNSDPLSLDALQGLVRTNVI